MKIIWKKITAIGFIAVLLVGLVMPMLGENAYAETAYTTDEFNTLLKVEETNTVYVTETIKVNFLEERHGIVRYIPYNGKTDININNKQQTIQEKMKIDQIQVLLNGQACDYSTSYEMMNGKKNLDIKIGSASKTVLGPQEYTLSYRCRLYDDGIKDFDFLYWDLIPTAWETPIGKSSVTIQMPKAFDDKNVQFLTGSYGEINSDKMPWIISNGVTLSANVSNLGQGEGITVIIELPNDYFQGEMTNDWAFTMMFGFILIPPVVIGLLWFLFGRDPRIVKTVEFYPPNGMTPAEAGYIVDGVVDKRDMVSMIIYFADKGYLTIEDKGSDVFILHKKTDLPTNAKIFEQTLFEGLFQNRDQLELKELGEDFYAHYKAAISQLEGYYKKESNKRVYTLSSTLARGFSFVLVLVPLVGGFIFGAIATMKEEMFLIGIAITNIVFLGAVMLTIAYDRKDAMKASSRRLLVILGVISTGIGFLAEFYSMWKTAGILSSSLMTASTLISVILTILMKKRTGQSAETTGKLLGFKDFINAAELDRIKLLVEENPSYFYHVLPYAYVFGLSDKWAKKFEQIRVEPPTWYSGTLNGNMFNTWLFISMMNSYTRSFSNNIVMPTSESSGGGIGGGFSSGGGFTGGGFGGGGGGAW